MAEIFLPLNVGSTISNSGGIGEGRGVAGVVASVVNVVVLLLNIRGSTEVGGCIVVEERRRGEGGAGGRVVE